MPQLQRHSLVRPATLAPSRSREHAVKVQARSGESKTKWTQEQLAPQIPAESGSRSIYGALSQKNEFLHMFLSPCFHHDLLRQYAELYALSLLGYCLMSNHVHLEVIS